jgi:hypothetical protein
MAIVSEDRQTNHYLIESLGKIYWAPQLEYVDYTYEDRFFGPYSADLVMTSGDWVYAQAKELFPNSPIIVAERVYTGNNLENILAHSGREARIGCEHTGGIFEGSDSRTAKNGDRPSELCSVLQRKAGAAEQH